MRFTAIVMLLATTISLYADESSVMCTEGAEFVTLRTEPSDSTEKSVEIPCPAFVWSFAEEPSGWVKVRSYDNGREGYAKADQVKPRKPEGYKPKILYPGIEVLFEGGLDLAAVARNREWDRQEAEAAVKAHEEAIEFGKKLAIAEASKPIVNVTVPPPAPTQCVSTPIGDGRVFTSCR